MLHSKLVPYYPNTWYKDYNCTGAKRYLEVQLSSCDAKYKYFWRKMRPLGRTIKKITRVECPHLYGLYCLTLAQYQCSGTCNVKRLYHDTGASKVHSILNTNLDRRLACRIKFGKGVSFSPYLTYANKKSSRSNGRDRAMIVADVLVGDSEHVRGSCTLPSGSKDTTIGNGGKVYVKFYDNEFYPKYIIYYDNFW